MMKKPLFLATVALAALGYYSFAEEHVEGAGLLSSERFLRNSSMYGDYNPKHAKNPHHSHHRANRSAPSYGYHENLDEFEEQHHLAARQATPQVPKGGAVPNPSEFQSQVQHSIFSMLDMASSNIKRAAESLPKRVETPPNSSKVLHRERRQLPQDILEIDPNFLRSRSDNVRGARDVQLPWPKMEIDTGRNVQMDSEREGQTSARLARGVDKPHILEHHPEDFEKEHRRCHFLGERLGDAGAKGGTVRIARSSPGAEDADTKARNVRDH